MTFSIQTGLSGYSGLQALERMEDRQKEIISRDPTVKRNISHFRDRMEFITSADDLVNDHRLFSMALGAFGIEDQAGNRGLIKKILTSDLNDQRSFANRLPDKRLLRMAKAFDFFRHANPFSSQDGKFLRSTGLINADRETQNKILQARDKIEILSKTSGSDARAWSAALDDPDLKEIIKSTFGFDFKFDILSPKKKIEKINRAINIKLDVRLPSEFDSNDKPVSPKPDALFKEFADPKNLERFFRSYAYATKNVSLNKKTVLTGEAIDNIAKAYVDREFERRVGLGDETMRLALNARRELADFAGRKSSKRALWFEVIGNPPLRTVFETAFGFGPEYAKLDVDRQAEEYTKASRRLLGTDSFGEINKPKTAERLIRNYLARAQTSIGSFGSTSGRYSAALRVLTGG